MALNWPKMFWPDLFPQFFRLNKTLPYSSLSSSSQRWRLQITAASNITWRHFGGAIPTLFAMARQINSYGSEMEAKNRYEIPFTGCPTLIMASDCLNPKFWLATHKKTHRLKMTQSYNHSFSGKSRNSLVTSKIFREITLLLLNFRFFCENDDYTEFLWSFSYFRVFHQHHHLTFCKIFVNSIFHFLNYTMLANFTKYCQVRVNSLF